MVSNLTIKEELLKSITFIDPESPRHIDWVIMKRSMHNLDTYSESHSAPNNRLRAGITEAYESCKIDDILKRPENRDIEIREFKTKYVLRQYWLRNDIIELVVSICADDREVSFVAFGDKDLTAEIINNVSNRFVEPNKVVITRITGFNQHGESMQISDEFLDTDPKMLQANDSFYPYFDRSIDDLVEQYQNSRSSILFLLGDVGLGKTTLLRTLMFKMKKKNNIVAVGDNIIMNPLFVTALHEMGKDSLVCVEDADRMCLKREGDDNHQMSGLLNFADGVSSIGNKIIISTNLSNLNKVDRALLRSGRTFEVLQFKKLTPDEANDARASIGLKRVTFDEDVSLADALNYDEYLAGGRNGHFGYAIK